ncbi:MAG: dethiobiotin synthase [Beggiatoa sp. IS2]|nr:MAG: dethiobiotin synthase [Beggiatoa sp. IS2]
MTSTWFITGTDTQVGKTGCTLALIQFFKNHGIKVVGMKPIASGGYETAQGLRNEDAVQIFQQCNNFNISYELINPYCFLPPIAPHLAAIRCGQTIQLDIIINAYQQLASQFEVVIVEGIGGWRVPINHTQSLKDMVLAIHAKVILVVGLRLGCINHALLTAEAIIRDGCPFAGWIANAIDPQFDSQESVATIAERLTVPLIAQMPYLCA